MALFGGFFKPDVEKLERNKDVEGLVKALEGENDFTVRQNAAVALGKMGASAVDPLITALKNSDWHVRNNAAELLGIIRDPRAVTALIVTLDDSDHYVRESAAEALGNIRDSRAVAGLIVALTKNSHHADYVEYNKIRKISAEALSKIGPTALYPLIGALKNSDAEVRKYAVEALGDIGDERAVEPLIVVLTDPDANVRKYARKYAAIALGKIRDARAVEPLIEALKDSSDDVRKYSAEALGNIKDPKAIKPLNFALSDSNKYVRKKASEALSKIGDSRAAEPLLFSQTDLDTEPRLSINLPIVVDSLSDGFSKFYEKSTAKNTFNIVFTPNSLVSKIYSRSLGQKIPNYEFIHIGGQVPDHISKSMLDSLKQGQTHHIISTIYLLQDAIESYSTALPLPDFLSSDNSIVNIWCIEPELSDRQSIQKSLEFGLFTKKWAPKSQQTINFIMSRENMDAIPTFHDLLSKFTEVELKEQLLSTLGIERMKPEIKKQVNAMTIHIEDKPKLVKELGTDPEKWIKRGLILLDDKKYVESIEYFNRALALNNSHPKVKEYLKRARQLRDSE